MPSQYYDPAQTTVMILAAGHGKRMRPLTEHTPIPLLPVAGTPLIEHHILRLAESGFKKIVINHAHLGQQIVEYLGDGAQFGLGITYSDESDSGPLETAGGILKALSLIESDPFLVVNGDIYTDFDFNQALLPLQTLGRLVLVTNPPQHPAGDFSIDDHGMLRKKSSAQECYTFSGIALYRKAFFKGQPPGALGLAPLFHAAIENTQLEAIVHSGSWHDIGTPERLADLDKKLTG